jgi:hypothetical protein
MKNLDVGSDYLIYFKVLAVGTGNRGAWWYPNGLGHRLMMAQPEMNGSQHEHGEESCGVLLEASDEAKVPSQKPDSSGWQAAPKTGLRAEITDDQPGDDRRRNHIKG